MPRGVPLSEQQCDQVRRRIFQQASQLFLRQGFHETPMRQVAQAAGMGKTTLYDYFPGKEEILLFFVEKLLDVTHVAAAEISQMDLPATKAASFASSSATPPCFVSSATVVPRVVALRASALGVYQIGEPQARSWIVGDTTSGGAMPSCLAWIVVQRGVGISSTRE